MMANAPRTPAQGPSLPSVNMPRCLPFRGSLPATGAPSSRRFCPSPSVYALDPNVFDGKLAFLGMNALYRDKYARANAVKITVVAPLGTARRSQAFWTNDSKSPKVSLWPGFYQSTHKDGTELVFENSEKRGLICLPLLMDQPDLDPGALECRGFLCAIFLEPRLGGDVTGRAMFARPVVTLFFLAAFDWPLNWRRRRRWGVLGRRRRRGRGRRYVRRCGSRNDRLGHRLGPTKIKRQGAE